MSCGRALLERLSTAGRRSDRADSLVPGRSGTSGTRVATTAAPRTRGQQAPVSAERPCNNAAGGDAAGAHDDKAIGIPPVNVTRARGRRTACLCAERGPQCRTLIRPRPASRAWNVTLPPAVGSERAAAAALRPLRSGTEVVSSCSDVGRRACPPPRRRCPAGPHGCPCRPATSCWAPPWSRPTRTARRWPSSVWAASGGRSGSSGSCPACTRPRSATRAASPPTPPTRRSAPGAPGTPRSVRVVFDPAVVSYQDLLRVFWESHDPTQGMRQGNDHGTQYRSAIYVSDPDQQASRGEEPGRLPGRAHRRGLREDHYRDRAGRPLLPRRGLPPAVPREGPERLLRAGRHGRTAERRGPESVADPGQQGFPVRPAGPRVTPRATPVPRKGSRRMQAERIPGKQGRFRQAGRIRAP